MIKEQAESKGFIAIPSLATFADCGAILLGCTLSPRHLLVLAPYYSGLQWAKQTGEQFHVVRSGHGLSSFLFPDVEYQDDETRRHEAAQNHDFF